MNTALHREGKHMIWLLFTIALWGILHSLLASNGTKNFFRHAFGNGFMRLYRLLYNLFALISFLPILYLMMALPDKILYTVPTPFSYLMRLGQGISLILLATAAFQTDLFSFVGLRQIFEEEKQGPLMTGGLYRYVRHPLYTFSLLILWLSPTMSLNSFIVYLALTVYILIGIVFEERKLLREFGEEYVSYRSVTPMLIPGRRSQYTRVTLFEHHFHTHLRLSFLFFNRV
jgi:protein-S-isoprenylcysteine O-methyltransferase Ste14